MLRTKLFRSRVIFTTSEDSLLNRSIKYSTRPIVPFSAQRSVMDEDFADRAEELSSRTADGGLRAPGGRDGRGGGRGGRGGGRGGRAESGGMNREVAISKALSKLLRHAAEEAGLKLDNEGYAHLDEVLKWQRLRQLNPTFDDIRTAVTDNAKQRFSIKPNPSLTTPPDPSSENPTDWVIRANQGHSIAIDSAALLVPITVEAGNIPEVVVHGTYYAFYQPIIDSGGLKRMSRNHIHFSTGLPEDKGGVISGMRNDAEILIYVDIRKSLEEGTSWWISDNGVILTEGDENGLVQTKYWKKVEGRRQDVGLLWEDGNQVAELPQSVRNRKAPSGKGPKGKREHEKSKGRDGAKRRGQSLKELDALDGRDELGTA